MALDNAAAMESPPRQQEDAFAAFRNAKHDPARREVSLCAFGQMRTGGGEVAAGPFLVQPLRKDGKHSGVSDASQRFTT